MSQEPPGVQQLLDLMTRFMPACVVGAAAELDVFTVLGEESLTASELAGRLRGAYFETLLGRQLQVLVETAPSDRPGVLLGTSARYAPVELPGVPNQIGQLVPLTAGSLVDGRIRVTD